MTATEASPPIPSVPSQRSRVTPGSIVIAESDDDLRLRIRLNLEAQGHQVTETASAQEAFESCSQNQPDLVVIDVDVPGGHDWSLLSALRDQTGPVVLISTPDDASMITALEMGLNDQLSKPVTPIALVARVQSALETDRLRDALSTERREHQQASGTDPLTGLHARGRIEELLAYTAATAARYDHPLSIVLIDVDFFTRLQDKHGIEAGRRVLSEIADHLAADLRKTDIAGRWTGDQFMVVLPHTDIKGATLFSERLRMTFSELPVKLPNGQPASITASFGCAQGTDIPHIVEHAQQMVTAAKRSGHNRVIA